jgi:hypothetical protein
MDSRIKTCNVFLIPQYLVMHEAEEKNPHVKTDSGIMCAFLLCQCSLFLCERSVRCPLHSDGHRE